MNHSGPQLTFIYVPNLKSTLLPRPQQFTSGLALNHAAHFLSHACNYLGYRTHQLQKQKWQWLLTLAHLKSVDGHDGTGNNVWCHLIDKTLFKTPLAHRKTNTRWLNTMYGKNQIKGSHLPCAVEAWVPLKWLLTFWKQHLFEVVTYFNSLSPCLCPNKFVLRKWVQYLLTVATFANFDVVELICLRSRHRGAVRWHRNRKRMRGLSPIRWRYRIFQNMRRTSPLAPVRSQKIASNALCHRTTSLVLEVFGLTPIYLTCT